jgi:Ca2+-transporting ATPase
MAVIFIGQILAVEFGGEVFRTVHLSATDWLTLCAVTCPVLIIGEIVRAIGRAKQR